MEEWTKEERVVLETCLNTHFNPITRHIVKMFNDVYTVFDENYKEVISFKKVIDCNESCDDCTHKKDCPTKIIIHWFSPMMKAKDVYFTFDNDINNVIEWFNKFYPEIKLFGEYCDKFNQKLVDEYLKVSKKWFNEE